MVPHVSKDHSLNCTGSTPFVGYILNASICDSTTAAPRLEDRTNSSPELLIGVVREIPTKSLFDCFLKLVTEFFQLFYVQTCISKTTSFLLFSLKESFHLLTNPMSFLRFDTCCFLHNNVAIHHDETSIGVIDKSFILSSSN